VLVSSCCSFFFRLFDIIGAVYCYLGGRLDPTWRSPNGSAQLHFLLAAFPPSREDNNCYRQLVKIALDQGCNVWAEDDQGRNALFLLCEQMALTPIDVCPDAARYVQMLVDQQPPYGSNGLGASDRSGRTIFHLIERAGVSSCLQSCKSLLFSSLPISTGNGGNVNNGGNNQQRSRVSSYSYDEVSPRVGSSIILQASNRQPAGSQLRSSSASTRLTSSYFDEEEDDVHPEFSQKRMISSSASFRSTSQKPAVLLRKQY